MLHDLTAKRYIRYMDDFLIIGPDKDVLHEYKAAIAKFVSERLSLTLHPFKSTVAPVRVGIDFLGYRLLCDKTRLRVSTVRRFVTRTRYRQKQLARGAYDPERFDAGLTAWKAYAAHADSWLLRKDIGERLGIELI